jgi:hypothetical protein
MRSDHSKTVSFGNFEDAFSYAVVDYYGATDRKLGHDREERGPLAWACLIFELILRRWGRLSRLLPLHDDPLSD